jgi:uncharacterized protein YwqG
MGLLNWIFGKKETHPVSAATANSLLEKVEVAPGVILPRALATYWEEIKKWKVSYIKMEATPGKPLKVQQSNFGYYPCLPKDFPYPLDTDGNYMYPLAQINCNELPALDNYPRTGYLQFYIATNPVYGYDFDNPRSQSNFRVLYFTNDEVKDFRTDFSFLEATLNSEYRPVNKPHIVHFSLKDEYFGMVDTRFSEAGMQKLEEVIDRYPSVSNQLEDYIWDNFESNGHKIGGYAFFTQTDPRHNENEDYILLLQIDSDKEIIWGDVGVANFFIRPGDLLQKDFSQVIYHWDCT